MLQFEWLKMYGLRFPSNALPQEETTECQRTFELRADACMWLTDWCAGAFSYWNFSQSEVGQLGISECHKVSPKICRAVKYAAPDVLRIARREAPISTFLSINLKKDHSSFVVAHKRTCSLLWIISMFLWLPSRKVGLGLARGILEAFYIYFLLVDYIAFLLALHYIILVHISIIMHYKMGSLNHHSPSVQPLGTMLSAAPGKWREGYRSIQISKGPSRHFEKSILPV